MRILLLYFLFGIFTIVNAQTDTLNQKDENDKKQGHWIYYGKDYPTKGYPAEGIIEQGSYVDNRKEGWWYKYHNDGKTLKLKGQYVRNRPNGNFFKYYPDGTLREEGSFRKGKYRDVSKRYYENGQLETFRTYNDEGKEIGESIYYRINGCINVKLVFKTPGIQHMRIEYRKDSCDIIQDTLEFYQPKPIVNPQPRIKYEKPLPNPRDSWRYDAQYVHEYSDLNVCHELGAKRKKYNANEEIFFDGVCKEGKVFAGKFYFYDSDGILLRLEISKDFKYYGVGQL